jgi:hypothetical protein
LAERMSKDSDNKILDANRNERQKLVLLVEHKRHLRRESVALRKVEPRQVRQSKKPSAFFR